MYGVVFIAVIVVHTYSKGGVFFCLLLLLLLSLLRITVARTHTHTHTHTHAACSSFAYLEEEATCFSP